jgi:uncharacterized membrane protein YkoI
MNKTILAIFLSLGLISFFNIKTPQAHGISPAEQKMKITKISLEQVSGEIVGSRIENDGGNIKYDFVVQTKNGWHEMEFEKATGNVLEAD